MEDIIIEQWNKAANSYFKQQEQSEFVDINKKIIAQRFNKLNRERVLDLGCGYGFYTHYLSSIGGNVIGCDGSEQMIQIAKTKYPDNNFDVVDIIKPLPYEKSTFDIVFCNQVLMDIDCLEDVYREVYKVLKPNGVFYFSIVHPAFYDGDWEQDETGFRKNKIMSRYISEYNFINEFWGETTHFHRTISAYINSAIINGFVLKHLDEPISYDGITKSKEFPLFLFAEFIK
jgi:SAM-dependent methyltransferase